MSFTRSAKATFALGATLIVLSAQATASQSSSSVRGIDSNGVAGIDSNGVLGIDSNGIAGIDSNGVLGIDSNGIAGIDSNGVLGIDSNGIAGIDSNGVLGIDSNGIAGIDSNGVLGIDSNGLLLAGPVDSIDRVNGVFSSMGQTVMASQAMLSSLRVGDFVAVQGSVISSGWYYADDVSVSSQRYVPGATEVFITGMLSSVDRVNGTAQMGNLTIDYTASLGSGEAPSSAMWSFQGTRPLSGGRMISNRSSDAR
jgi:hypothetical protein